MMRFFVLEIPDKLEEGTGAELSFDLESKLRARGIGLAGCTVLVLDGGWRLTEILSDGHLMAGRGAETETGTSSKPE